jgi:hypothetical protein
MAIFCNIGATITQKGVSRPIDLSFFKRLLWAMWTVYYLMMFHDYLQCILTKRLEFEKHMH